MQEYRSVVDVVKVVEEHGYFVNSLQTEDLEFEDGHDIILKVSVFIQPTYKSILPLLGKLESMGFIPESCIYDISEFFESHIIKLYVEPKEEEE